MKKLLTIATAISPLATFSTVTGASAANYGYCRSRTTVAVQREDLTYDLCTLRTGQCVKAGYLKDLIVQRPTLHNIAEAKWDLGNAPGGEHVTMSALPGNTPEMTVEPKENSSGADSVTVSCDGPAVPGFRDQKRPSGVHCTARGGFGDLGAMLRIEVTSDGFHHIRVSRSALDTEGRTVPDPGTAAVDLSEGLTLLREGSHAALVSEHGITSCFSDSDDAPGAVRPITSTNSSERSAAVARAEAYKAAQDEEAKKRMEADDAERAAYSAAVAPTFSCSFDDGARVDGGTFRGPSMAEQPLSTKSYVARKPSKSRRYAILAADLPGYGKMAATAELDEATKSGAATLNYYDAKGEAAKPGTRRDIGGMCSAKF